MHLFEICSTTESRPSCTYIYVLPEIISAKWNKSYNNINNNNDDVMLHICRLFTSIVNVKNIVEFLWILQCCLQQQQQHRRPVFLGICCVFINDKTDEWIQKYTKIKSELARTENGDRERKRDRWNEKKRHKIQPTKWTTSRWRNEQKPNQTKPSQFKALQCKLKQLQKQINSSQTFNIRMSTCHHSHIHTHAYVPLWRYHAVNAHYGI